ncbi:Na/Pi cotransporter family protein [Halobacteriovorax sp. HLS]|uniref:Na/Pi cotransporter family protein n=1 Tax=Halobacteriovorax sp. HLS TaxID=2234000 RepID=UPI000FDBD08F|nr:Na/Pi symporter [Halobacteriovorax sp. HLS]
MITDFINQNWTLLGGIGFFIFAINFLVHSMQSLSGKMIRGLHAKSDINNTTSLGIGFISGASVLSVSSCTNMIVGLVNSGIVNFKNSAILIMGINIGASLFPWLLTFDLGNWSYLFIFAGAMGHYFIRTLVVRLVSRVILSIGMLYLGLNLSVNFFSSDHLLNIEFLMNTGFLYLLISFIAGALVSYLLNSTALLVGIFMAFFYTHSISVEIACAILLGANLGPSFKLYLNSLQGNIDGSRTALFNILLNGAPVLLYLLLLSYYGRHLHFFEDMMGTVFVLPVFYTSIQILNALFATIFYRFLENSIHQYIKTPNVKIPQKLISFGGSRSMVPATSLWQANRELKKLKSILDRMFTSSSDYIQTLEGHPKALARIKKYEDVTDRINSEMVDYVEDLIEHSLNAHQSRECLKLLNTSREFENIADYINKFVTYKTTLSINNEITEEQLQIVSELFNEAHSLFYSSCQSLTGVEKMDPIVMRDLSQEFKSKCEEVRFTLASGNLVFSDMIFALRKIRSHSYRLFVEL